MPDTNNQLTAPDPELQGLLERRVENTADSITLRSWVNRFNPPYTQKTGSNQTDSVAFKSMRVRPTRGHQNEEIICVLFLLFSFDGRLCSGQTLGRRVLHHGAGRDAGCVGWQLEA